ncbi:MAG: InlB B-repeat-containing protein, partial [Clostridia bacterium]|nr:InlB B-repeat-containing protein [Clostridia bacterium]
MSKKKFITLMMCLAIAGASMGVMSACGGDSASESIASIESNSNADSASDETPSVLEFKVTFNSLGGSDVKAQLVKNGAKATKPEDPTREDYTFVEWQLNGNTYDFSTRVTGDITLTAKWEKKAPAKFTVSFVVEGETEPFHTAEVETGKKVMAPADEPMREGYVFDGWTLNGADYDFETPVTEALTLTAKWINLWMVTFDVGEGTAVEAVEVKDGDKLAIPETIPTRENY